MYNSHSMPLLTDVAKYSCPNYKHSNLLIQNMFCILIYIHGKKHVLSSSMHVCMEKGHMNSKHVETVIENSRFLLYKQHYYIIKCERVMKCYS